MPELNKYMPTGLMKLWALSLYDKAKWLTLLAIVVLVFWVFLFVLMYWVKTDVRPQQPDRSLLQPVELVPYSRVSEHEAALTERPLFWPERRPEPEEVATEAAPQVKGRNNNVNNFVLLGILSTGELSTVNVDYKGEVHRLKVGETLAGWTLQSVVFDEVIFVESASAGKDNENTKSIRIYPAVNISPYWPRDAAEFNEEN